MKTKIILSAVFTILISNYLCAGAYEKKTFNAQKNENETPVIDGILDDKAWQNAYWDNGFVQYRPSEGEQPSQKTWFSFLYDDNFIYVGVKAYDTSPDKIVKRLTRRDQIEGDAIGVQFDSYHNQRTAYCFYVSAAGVKSDYFMSNDGENTDRNWDPIWYVKTTSDENGWYAEIKIPLSQLRFNPKENSTWGLQIERRIYRYDEVVLWQPISRNAPGWVHYLGLLSGLENIEPKKTFDIVPYALTSAESFEKQPGNPFANGKSYGLNAGVDGKIGITNYLTLDFTVNPDFGQVEADPSQVNLTAFESYLSEKRPFFIEGSDLFNYKLGFGDGDMGNENLFYSRRIGRSPQYHPMADEDEYINAPEFTPIIGALKLTGRTNDGLSVGIMQSTTASQYADIDKLGETTEILIEPLTSYFAGRAIQELNDGKTTIGFMGTAVNRDIKEDHLDFMHTSAYSAGLDLKQYIANRKYMFVSTAYMSHVNGSKTAITRTQLSPARYFQRPDADHLNFDTERTSLTGAGGNLQFWKIDGNLKFVSALLIKSPELETNDIGYLRETDNITQVLWAGYSINKPIGILRSININTNEWTSYTFGGERTNLGGNVNLWMQFTNYWHLSIGSNINHEPLSTTMLRGGPAFSLPGNMNVWLNLNTDSRKKISLSTSANYYMGFNNYRKYTYNNLGISYRPLNTLLITLTPSYNTNINDIQYVSTKTYNEEPAYILGKLDQKVIAMSLRINYTITPELTLQFWGQPFIASGEYTEFKKVTSPKANNYHDRFHAYIDNQIAFDQDANMYNVYENNNENPDYSFHNPDFNFKEFLSNLVLRWEYKPGSTLYFVWSQTRDHFARDGSFNFQNDTDMLFTDTPHNIFMLKFSYRIGI